jgi:hypothetical protein
MHSEDWEEEYFKTNKNNTKNKIIRSFFMLNLLGNILQFLYL